MLWIELKRRDMTFQEISDAVNATTCAVVAHSIALACHLQRAGVSSLSGKRDSQ